MTDTPRVALDAFGSDRRPEPELEAAASLLAADAEAMVLELVGDRARLEPSLAESLASLAGARTRVEVVHAASEIEMGESPARAVRAKPDASLCVAIDRLAAGEVGAVVSAGNTGAILAAAMLRLGRSPGVERPAIATRFPWIGAGGIDGSGCTILLDAGANVQCKVINLAQFAVIGATFAGVELGVARPRVGVLANGREASKGTTLTREAHDVLVAGRDAGLADGFEYVGYVEPDALFTGACDVAVTDGWTGNISLKLAEAAMSAWPKMLHAVLESRGEAAITAAITPALQQLARQLDPDAHGGAPLLGVDGAVIICHGSAGPRAIHSALSKATRFARRNLSLTIARAIEDHGELFELARNRAPS